MLNRDSVTTIQSRRVMDDRRRMGFKHAPFWQQTTACYRHKKRFYLLSKRAKKQIPVARPTITIRMSLFWQYIYFWRIFGEVFGSVTSAHFSHFDLGCSRVTKPTSEHRSSRLFLSFVSTSSFDIRNNVIMYPKSCTFTWSFFAQLFVGPSSSICQPVKM